MPPVAPVVEERLAGPQDTDFLRELFVGSRPELAVLESLGGIGRDLVDVQVTAQRAQYAAEHPGARDHVLLVGPERVGRCWTATSASELRVLDLAVHEAHRRRGIGRSALERCVRRAEALGVPLRLSVWQDNLAARALYTATGLRVVDEHGGRLAMERSSPATCVAGAR